MHMASKTHLLCFSTFLFLIKLVLQVSALHSTTGNTITVNSSYWYGGFSSSTTIVVKSAYWFVGFPFIPASDIDSTLFTHLYCAFADLDPQTSHVTIASQNLKNFSTFTQTVQLKNPNIKTLLSIGGDKGAEIFASMANQSSTLKSFIDSSISLARSYNFHGLDIDWEFPSTAAEMSNLGILLTEWRAAVVNDLPPDHWQPCTTRHTSQVSGDSGVTVCIQAGLAPNKIVFGLPFYGMAWNLVDPNQNGIFAPANGSALIPSLDGALGYIHIKSFIAERGATKLFNATFVTNYCYSENTWIGYDDVESTYTKVSYIF